MNRKDSLPRMDTFSIGFFGLAVSAFTFGFFSLGIIPHSNLAVAIICLIFGGIAQILAGVIDIKNHNKLGGTTLTIYGFYWIFIFVTKAFDLAKVFHWDNIFFIPIVAIYAIFFAVMVYLTSYKSFILMLLYIFITLSFVLNIFIGLDFSFEDFLGIDHVIIGFLAFYYSMVTLVIKYDRKFDYLLGKPLFKLLKD